MGTDVVRWLQTGRRGYLPNDLMPNTFLAVTHDFFGKRAELHEAEKQRVSKRY